jgi:NADPH-dependent curcumin reductase CurA
MSLLFQTARVFRLSTTSSIASTRLASLSSQLGSRDRFVRAMSSLPKTDVPVPEPKGDEVLIKNEYIGINYIDT